MMGRILDAFAWYDRQTPRTQLLLAVLQGVLKTAAVVFTFRGFLGLDAPDWGAALAAMLVFRWLCLR
jgi:hypothetical protein